MAVKNLIGLKFGRLTVIEQYLGAKCTMWVCKCDCGNVNNVQGGALKSGRIKSCGCFRKDRMVKHGDCGTQFYRCWKNIKLRCLNPKSDDYATYGGAGIKLSKSWLIYDNFKKDMFKTFKPGLTLDRINGKKGYYKNNCRWATTKEQNRNRKSNRIIDTPWGKLLVVEAAEKAGISNKTLIQRLNRNAPESELFSKTNFKTNGLLKPPSCDLD